ncbi:MAG: tetratricopeptide repeat protein [Bacteroidota bacterium]|nr:tetratricopeptide repeat protein [Bacteroidota bacterium]
MKSFPAKTIYIALCLCWACLTGNSLEAQNNSQLAFEYYRNNEFDKAATLFHELYQQRNNQHYRNYYIQSLVKADDLETAEAFVQKELKNNRHDTDLLIEQAYIWEMQGDKDKAQKAYERIISNNAYTTQSVVNLANNFIRKRKFDLAEQTYLTGQENIRGENFYYHLANLYSIQRKYEEMAEAYMNLLALNPSYKDRIQTRLQNLSAHDIDKSLNPILEKTLIKRVQKHPDKPVFSEMLSWQYIQTGKYEDAINQAIALDRRYNEKGRRLYELGKIAANNNKTETALECFDYIYKKGRTSPYYFPARLIELSEKYKSITQKTTVDTTQLNDLEKLVISTRNDAPRKLQYPLLQLLAKIQAYYLNKPETALQEIDSLLKYGYLDNNEKYNLQLLRGDIYLMNNNPWEASLIYAKVEQHNKENPIGAEAKFKKAKMAYYTGQFEWAVAQLDVLKASTSKLIANNAMELSLFIKDNTANDSLQPAMSAFARADLLEFKHDYNEALIILDSIIDKFPSNELVDDVLFRKARIKEKQGLNNEAVTLFSEVVSGYGYGMLADNALIAKARIQHNKLNDEEAALKSYSQLLMNYKGSIFTSEARELLRELRGETPNVDKPQPKKSQNLSGEDGSQNTNNK